VAMQKELNFFGETKNFEKHRLLDFLFLLDSKRNYLNYTESLFPNFAAKHTISIVAKKFVTAWKTGFNFSYNYNSGRPYYNFVTENGNTVLKNQGQTKRL
jgi:formylmethanofuran dehydrogenase subunit B